MRWLCIQVQPDRAPGIEMDQVTSAFVAVASMPELVESHSFTSGEDHGPYFNFAFGTLCASRLRETIQMHVYKNESLARYLKCSSIVTCSAEDGWDDYLLLFHFDRDVKLDSTSALRSA